MVVGRSDIVGKPAAMLLLNANATVTVCHSKTRDLPAVCRRADILVAAIGRAGMITHDFVKPGATVIDVGMNKVTDPAEFQRLFGGNCQNASEETFAPRARRWSAMFILRWPKSRERSPRSRRRWPADHRHADVQHREGRENAARQ